MDTFEREYLRELMKDAFREADRTLNIKTCETRLDKKIKSINDYDLEQIFAEALHEYNAYKEAGLI